MMLVVKSMRFSWQQENMHLTKTCVHLIKHTYVQKARQAQRCERGSWRWKEYLQWKNGLQVTSLYV